MATDILTINFSFSVKQEYTQVLSIKVEGDRVPDGISAAQYLRSRVSDELNRVLGQIPIPGDPVHEVTTSNSQDADGTEIF